jgi:hypothetical protein
MTREERVARDKHFSLFNLFVSDKISIAIKYRSQSFKCFPLSMILRADMIVFDPGKYNQVGE